MEKEAQSNKKRRQTAENVEVTREEQEDEILDNEIIFEGDDDDVQPPVMLMYNSVRSYVSAIHELWAHQTSQGLHHAPRPNKVAIKALQTSLIRGEHARRREEYTDRGKGTMRDGYLQRQIPDLTHQVWSLAFGEKVAEQSFRTLVDFLFGNTMLLRLSNRVPMELPDLFLMSLPKEGVKGNGWCLVCVIDQGEYFILFLTISDNII